MRAGLRSNVPGLVCMAILLSGAASPADAPVADAAMRGDVAAVRSLLAQGADVNGAQGDGMTALHWAAERSDVEIAELVLSAGADVEARTRIGDYTPLHVASKGAHLAVVEMLLEAEADVNARTTNSGSTALHLAAAAFNGAPVVAALLDGGADANAREASAGQTPLMFAAASNRAVSVEELLAHGADPALQTVVMDVPTRVAQDRRGHRELERILEFIEGCGLEPTLAQSQEAVRLVRAGLDKELQPFERWGPPVLRDHDNISERFGPYLSIREVLVDKWGGMTALLHAARKGQIEAAMALLDGGAGVNQVSGGIASSPLVTAAINGHFDLAKRLLERGADPNLATSNDGVAPLFAVINTQWAIKSEYPQPRAQDNQQTDYMTVVEALLDAGADPNARLKTNLWYFDHGTHIMGMELTGATPMWRASFAQDVELLRLLASHGADSNIPTYLPELGMRLGRKSDSRTDDDSGLPPLPAGTPNTFPIHMAAGGGHLGFGGSAARHAPNGTLPSVQFLVEEFDVDVNMADAWGYTPVHYAAAWGKTDVIRYLVSKGADVMGRTRLGQTTADMAAGGYRAFFKAQEYPETVEVLESLGVKVECVDSHFGGTGAVCPSAVANGAIDYANASATDFRVLIR